MKVFFAMLALLFVACAPSERVVSEIPSYVSVYATITLEGVDSLDTFTQMTISMREKAANHGFIFRAYNTSSTSISALWIKVAGQSAQTYFRADEIKENDKKNRVVLTLLTDPNPPPLVDTFNRSLGDMLTDLADRLKLPYNKIKIQLK
ncbi:MAG: hypothetical protein ACK41E_09405 [Deinococcales bacterium]